MYKVCWSLTDPASCYDADVLVAIDQAIDDDVDVINLSVGDRYVVTFEGILIEAFYLHVTLLCYAFAHCEKFPNAISRRSLGCVLVPMKVVSSKWIETREPTWLITGLSRVKLEKNAKILIRTNFNPAH